MDTALRLSIAAAQLDRVTYYELLNVAPDAERQALQQAFHRFALVYHPDRHVDATDGLREIATRIFERGVEAYGVLRDPTSREAYEKAILAGDKRLSPREMERITRSKAAQGTIAPPPRRKGFVDSMVSSEGREVAERIERLMADGRYAQAYQQISLLQNLEPGNKAVSERTVQLGVLARRQSSGLRGPKR